MFRMTTLILTGLVAVFVHLPSVALGEERTNKISDERIEMAIDGELWGAKSVNANGIDVASRDGIVTLSGEINNLLSKETAVRIAQMTKGVRSVVDRLKVIETDHPDRKLRRDVLEALAQDPATDTWEITVTVESGNVTLQGAVDSYAERELAEKVAKSTRGVQEITNRISVKYQSDRSDGEIKRDIEQRLAWDSRLDDELVTVDVDAGEVTLSGAVGSDYERKIASGDCWIAGVKTVNTEDLKVTWWSRDAMQRQAAWQDLADNEIRQAVSEALLYDPRVLSFNPKVTVDDGVVTLTGVVDNLKAKRAAAQDAKNTVGVWLVKNHLKVRPSHSRPNDKIKQDIDSAFARDLWVDRFDIITTVIDGEVYLHGDVDSYFEKEQAEDLAATVNGVTDVHNQLEVPYDYPANRYLEHYDWDPTLYDYDNDSDLSTTHTKSDREIKLAIESQLWWSPWVDEDEIEVVVSDGTVTLTGNVDSWNERSKATENALEGGALKVINQLKMK